MELEELLNLDYSKENIKKIDKALAKLTKNSQDYLKLLSHKLLISPKINDSLRQIYSYVIDFDTLNDEEIVLICNTIMALTLKVKRLDEYEKYLQIKSNHLKASALNELHYDKYLYYKACQNNNEAVIELKNYLDYDLDLKSKTNALTELLNLAYDLKNTDLFLDVRTKLISIYEKNLDTVGLNNLNLKTIKIYYYLNLEEKCQELLQNYLQEESLPTNYKLEAATIQIKIFIKQKSYRKASIVESEYSDLLKDNYTNESLDFAKTALELYKALENNYSIKFYEEIIKNILTKQADKPKEKKEVYIIPEIIKEDKKHNDKIIIKEEVVVNKFNQYVISENNEVLRKLIHTFNKENYRLRDILRDVGYILEKNYNVVKFNLIYKANEYYLHTYKNNKLYDRTYQEIPDSLIKYSYERKEDFVLDKELLIDKIDIFTNEIFVNNFVAEFIITSNNEILGVMEIIADNDFLAKNNNYEIFTLFREVLNLKIKEEIYRLKLNDQHALNNYLISNFYYGLKKIIGQNIYLSGEARRILRIDNEITLDEFYNYLAPNEVNKYKDFIKKLYNEPKNNQVISYKYVKDNIVRYLKEIYYVYINESNYNLVSILIDETDNINRENMNLDKAYIWQNTGFYTVNKLYLDLEKTKDKRFSLAVFSSDEIKEYKELYGNLFYTDFLKLLYKNLKTYLAHYLNVSYYMLDDYNFSLLLIDFNDKRKEESLLKGILKFLDNGFIDLKYSVYPIFRMGVYLKAKPENKEILNIIDYASNALLDTDSYNRIAYHNFKSYKSHFKEREKYITLRENILNNQIRINYQQLVDIINMEVYGYIVKLNIPNLNIYEDEIEQTLTKHHKLELYHKYKLTALCQQLKQLYAADKVYVEVISSFSNKVIDDKFADFVLTELQFFKIPPEVLSIIVDSYSTNLDLLQNNKIKIITRNIYDIFNKKCKNLYLDLNKLNITNLETINEALKNFDVCIYLGNVDNKEDISLIKAANIKYIFGKAYSKTYKIEELIEKIKDE